MTAAARWVCGVDGPATRLYGGEESAAWRVGEHVVRVAGFARDPAEVEWCHRVAAAARAGGCAEALAPLPLPGRPDGATAAHVEGRTVSLWPHVDGVWASPGEAGAVLAARLLARLHRALAPAALPPRPRPNFLLTGLDGRATYEDPRLRDPRLDAWLREFHARARAPHPLHGDFYRGNLLAAPGDPARLLAVLDWDEALVAPPETEVASAAMEFAGDFGADTAAVRRFVRAYRESGGTARLLDDEALAQLMRHRLRCESVRFADAAARGEPQDAEDLAHHRRRLTAFARLRP
nr:phosphotransferase [Streptomyces sp. HNM0574]